MYKELDFSQNRTIFDLIKCSLWNSTVPKLTISVDVFQEMCQQAIVTLPAPILSRLYLDPELRQKWDKIILQQIAYYIHYKNEQENLPVSVPYVILKGTGAAQYYPFPEFRILGDIDIITKQEDFEKAYQELLDAGYKLVEDNKREKGFVKNGFLVELHYYFASQNNPEQAAYLDELIFSNINGTHMLPDMINGIVILEHLSKHLENGLGLRQVIDWMMFVDKCVPDNRWSDFQTVAKPTGMETLAIVITQMCVMYLGLPERKWCFGARKELCEQLMDYVLLSGNFGNKRTEASDFTKNVFAKSRSLKSSFILLQEQGLNNWEAAKHNKILRPFSWVYQTGRYIKNGLQRKASLSTIISEYRMAKQQNDMFDALGVRQTYKGDIVFENGQFVKKRNKR